MPQAKWTGYLQDASGRRWGRKYGGEMAPELEDPPETVKRRSLDTQEIGQGLRMVETLRTDNILYRDVMNNIRRIFEVCTGSTAPKADELVSFVKSTQIPNRPFAVGRAENYELLIKDVTEKRRGHRLSVEEIDLIDRLLRVAEYQYSSVGSVESKRRKEQDTTEGTQ